MRTRSAVCLFHLKFKRRSNDAAGQFQESFVDESEVLEADAQSPEVVKPGNGALYDPAGFTRPLP
jgi:hypothetical protein